MPSHEVTCTVLVVYMLQSLALLPCAAGVVNLVIAIVALFVFIHYWRQYGKGLKEYCKYCTCMHCIYMYMYL